jgi:flagellar hook-length control protein FliK
MQTAFAPVSQNSETANTIKTQKVSENSGSGANAESFSLVLKKTQAEKVSAQTNTSAPATQAVVSTEVLVEAPLEEPVAVGEDSPVPESPEAVSNQSANPFMQASIQSLLLNLNADPVPENLPPDQTKEQSHSSGQAQQTAIHTENLTATSGLETNASLLPPEGEVPSVSMLETQELPLASQETSSDAEPAKTSGPETPQDTSDNESMQATVLLTPLTTINTASEVPESPELPAQPVKVGADVVHEDTKSPVNTPIVAAAVQAEAESISEQKHERVSEPKDQSRLAANMSRTVPQTSNSQAIPATTTVALPENSLFVTPSIEKMASHLDLHMTPVTDFSASKPDAPTHGPLLSPNVDLALQSPAPEATLLTEIGPAQTLSSPTSLSPEQTPIKQTEQTATTQTKSPVFPLLERMRLMRQDGQNQIRMSLQPAELGRVSLQLLQKDQALHLQIFTETFMAKDLLESQMGQLKQSLQQQGLQLQQFLVEVNPDRAGNGFSQDRQPEQSPYTTSPKAMSGLDESEFELDLSNLLPRSEDNSQVNYLA